MAVNDRARLRAWLVRRLNQLVAWIALDAIFLFAATAILLAAFSIRLYILNDNFSQGWDEGAYLISARLIAAGYQPFSQIYMPQLPIFLDNLAWFFGLVGDSLWLGRLLIAFYSLLGLAACALAARLLSNRIGALATLIILTINPGYLTYSRAVYLEVPAIALSMLAVVCVLFFTRTGARRWLVACGLLWGASVLIKPFLLGVGLALVLYPALYRWQVLYASRFLVRARAMVADWFLVGLASLVPVIFFLATIDLPAFYFQFIVVNQRLIPEGVIDGLGRMVGFLGRDWGMLALAVFAGVLGLRKPGMSSTFPLALGTLGTLAFVLSVPHYNHHDVVLIPLLATLAGVGVARLIDLVGTRGAGAFQTAALVAGTAALLVYIVNAPRIGLFDYRLLQIPDQPRADACVQLIAQQTRPNDFIISDQPMLVYQAGRLIPPAVAISGGADIDAGGVTTQALLESASQYQPPLIIISNRYRKLDAWTSFVQTRYRRVTTCNDSGSDVIELYQAQ